MATKSNKLTDSFYLKSSCSYSCWDVFLSFRGTDTRNDFTAYLYFALDQAGIRIFRDDSELEKGEKISSELIKAIHDSKVSILDELVEIPDCRRLKGQVVHPVFYHVDPSDVRYQKGSFAEAFQKHKTRFSAQIDKVEKWKLL